MYNITYTNPLFHFLARGHTVGSPEGHQLVHEDTVVGGVEHFLPADASVLNPFV